MLFRSDLLGYLQGVLVADWRLLRSFVEMFKIINKKRFKRTLINNVNAVLNVPDRQCWRCRKESRGKADVVCLDIRCRPWSTIN